MLAKHAEVQQHVALESVADEEAEATRRVEPFHPARIGGKSGRGSVDSSDPFRPRSGLRSVVCGLMRVHNRAY